MKQTEAGSGSKEGPAAEMMADIRPGEGCDNDVEAMADSGDDTSCCQGSSREEFAIVGGVSSSAFASSASVRSSSDSTDDNDDEQAAQQEFFDAMRAVGRDDLLFGSLHHPEAITAGDNNGAERMARPIPEEKLKSYAPSASYAAARCVSASEGKYSERSKCCDDSAKSSSVTKTVASTQSLKAAPPTTELKRSVPLQQQLSPREDCPPGAYDEAPGRESIRLERMGSSAISNFGGNSSMGSFGAFSEDDVESSLDIEDENPPDSDDQKDPSDSPTALTAQNSSAYIMADDVGSLREQHIMVPESGDLIEAHTVDDIVEVVKARPMEWWHRHQKMAIILILVTVLALTAIIATTVSLKDDKDQPSSAAPSMAPTMSPFVRIDTIANLITDSTTNPSLQVLEDPGNPQTKALEWLAWDDALQVSVEDEEHIRQRYALAVIYFSTGGVSNWTEQYEFLSPTHECTWSGALQCDNDVVTGIELTENNLLGQLPPEISLLTALRSLGLDDNQLSGSLPSYLPPKLERLDIWNNDVVGTIPSFYTASLTELESFRVGKNALNGTIPEAIGQSLTKLTSLSLESNHLTGSIPSSIWNLSRMRDFQIGQQELTGSLSPLIGRWTNVTVFHTNKQNGLTGTIPTEVGLLTQLTSLKFSQNHLRGTLPTELGNLEQISLLAISRNGINGTIPTELARLSTVEQIYLQNTWLEGDTDFICKAKENGSLPHLHMFNADMEEVNCTCCTCCMY